MNPTTIAEMQAKAAELRAKYPGQCVLIEVSVWAMNHESYLNTTPQWRIHVVANDEKGLAGDAITGGDFEIVEAQIHRALDPKIKHERALARAEKLEAEAASLRASVGGAA